MNSKKIIGLIVILVFMGFLIYLGSGSKEGGETHRRNEIEQVEDTVGDTSEFVSDENYYEEGNDEEENDEGPNIDFYSPKDTYIVGEAISFVVNSDRDGYAYLFSTDKTGRIIMVFPNPYAKDNKIVANRETKIPPVPENQRGAIIAKEPGKETVILVFSNTYLGDRDVAFSQLVKNALKSKAFDKEPVILALKTVNINVTK